MISSDQTAYIKNRFIGTYVRMIYDIFELAENGLLSGALLFLDFEKAFDSVEWNFIYQVLEKFGFGENYIRWIQILYKNPEFMIKNNGWISATCKMSRGIRQGCPISALLFILVVEMMSIDIKQNENITGLTIGDTEIKISQYADDTTICVANKDSVVKSIECIKRFESTAGPKLNIL